MPSISFWTSGLGKDSLAFMAVGLALWASFNLGKRKGLMVISILVMLIVRPHIASFMVVALAIASVFDNNSKVLTKIFLATLATIATIVLIPLAMNYTGIGEGANSNDLASYIEKRQGYNLEGGGSVDISNMLLPMQMFTYLFRPFILEARSIAGLMASLDNLLLLYLFIMGLLSRFRGVTPNANLNLYFILTYSSIALTILAMTTSNLGIALRQKWMVVPFLIVLLLSYFANSKIGITKEK